jgi:HEPN domain-containing protein
VNETPRERAALYLRRGEDLLSTAQLALAAGLTDGVATSGVQAGIALADAYTVGKLGMRSRGQDHFEAIGLIQRVTGPEAKRVAVLFQRIVERKTEVEYADRTVSAADARQLLESARRLASLVRQSLA